MAAIKIIWGPVGKLYHIDRLVWRFVGLRINGEYARWHLAFWYDSRRFTTKPMLGHPNDEKLKRKLADWPVNTPPLTGRVTPMLRALLKPEHIAEATRLALEWQRKRP